LLCLNECSVSTDWGVHKSSIFIHMKNMECQKLYLGYCLRSNNNWKSIMTKRFTITWNCPTNVHISLRYSPLRTADLEVTKLTGTIFNHPWSGVCRPACLPASLAIALVSLGSASYTGVWAPLDFFSSFSPSDGGGAGRAAGTDSTSFFTSVSGSLIISFSGDGSPLSRASN